MSECRYSCASHWQGALLSSSLQKAEREQHCRQDAGQTFDTAAGDSLGVQLIKGSLWHRRGFGL